MKINQRRFVTQIEYREKSKKIILGWIGTFNEGGVVSKRGFLKSYKSTVNGKTWTRTWTSRDGAIKQLLKHHGLDTTWGTYHVIPCPQTFSNQWKPLDYNEIYNSRDELVQETKTNARTKSD